MAPTTRRQAKAQRPIHSGSAIRAAAYVRGGRRPEVPPMEGEQEETRPRQVKRISPTAPRVSCGAVTKLANPVKVISKPPPKKRQPLPRKECSICATSKVLYQFKAPRVTQTCEHFEEVCMSCIQKMLRSKVTERQFDSAGLACPFPNCDHVLEFNTLKGIVTAATFEYYDTALTKNLFNTHEAYQSCLNNECGKFFSTEDCEGKKGQKKIACPYCNYKTCTKCDRPWMSHDKGGCDQVKANEDKQSEEKVKTMGAKACPGCGINVVKNGGCDHMKCQRCKIHYCWRCLAPLQGDAPHYQSCPHAGQRLADDPGNWLPDIDLGAVLEIFRMGPLQPQNAFAAAHPQPQPQAPFLGEAEEILPLIPLGTAIRMTEAPDIPAHVGPLPAFPLGLARNLAMARDFLPWN